MILKRKVLILANPNSGKKKSLLLADKVKDQLLIQGFEVDTLFTKAESNFLTETRDFWDEAITDLVAIGGDGTLNLAANILHKKNVVLNIIPSGTGNDFVKNIDLGKTVQDQIETIVSGRVMEIDVGKCNGKLFLNGIGLGFDGQIVYDNLNRKSILKGHAKYYAQVLRILATFKPLRIRYTVNGQKSQDDILLMTVASGTTFGGGFRLTPDANISDGSLDVCVIRQISPLRRFWEVTKLTKGTHGKLSAVNFDRGQTITVEGDKNIKAHIDGEYFGAPPYHIEILPKHLTVRVK